MIKIAHTNFWPNFASFKGDPESRFVKHLLDLAFPGWTPCWTEEDADIVLTSVFPHAQAAYPAKTIAVIWENIRPDYRNYRFSLSYDFDDYGGRNIRCPLWFTCVDWGQSQDTGTQYSDHRRNEPLVPLSVLGAPREGTYVKRWRFCAIVASNPEACRIEAAKMLSKIAPVHAYGAAFGGRDQRLKPEILKDYVFSICFENGLYPGYYTEKPLQAWTAGTIPLYYSDKGFDADFNPLCCMNLIDYSSLEEFANGVRYIYGDDARLERIWRQPLLTKEPSLDPIVSFLKKALHEISTSV